MLTEEHAREKWCPFSRVLDGQPGNMEGQGACAAATNRGVRDKESEYCLCITSECMAWRWDTEHNDLLLEEARQAYQENADYEMPQRPPLRDSAEMEEANRRRMGFCGLARRSS